MLTISEDTQVTLNDTNTVDVDVSNHGLLYVYHSANTTDSALSTLHGTVVNQTGGTIWVRPNQAVWHGITTLTLAITTGLTNHGTIALDQSQTANDSRARNRAILQVDGGPLVNESTGTIVALAGSGTNVGRTITATVDNRGIIEAQTDLTITPPTDGTFTNTGTIEVTGGNLTISLTEVDSSFATTGIIDIESGRTLTVNGGEFNYDGGNLNGEGTLSLSNTTANLNANLETTETDVLATETTINGPGQLTISADTSLTLLGDNTDHADLINRGWLFVTDNFVGNGSASSSLTGSVINEPTGTVRVWPNQTSGGGFSSYLPTVTLVLTQGLTNRGRIELTQVARFLIQRGLTNLQVTGGDLLNETTGSIVALPGSGTNAGRTITANVDNRGIIEAQTDLTITPPTDGTFTNTGTVEVTGGNLTVSLTEADSSFSTTGLVNTESGRTLTVSGGEFNYNGGNLTGEGTLSFSNATAHLNTNLETTALDVLATESTIHGPGQLTISADTNLTLMGDNTVHADLINQGWLFVTDNFVGNGSALSSLTGSVINESTGTIRVWPNQTSGGGFSSYLPTVTLVLTQGLTNRGRIELTQVARFSIQRGLTNLQVTGGDLLNEATGSIVALPGSGTNAGRTITATVDNRGTIEALTDLTITPPTPEATFSSTGLIQVNTGQVMHITGGTLTNLVDGTLTGGTYILAGQLRLPVSEILANAAHLEFVGSGSLRKSNNSNALSEITTNTTTGLIRVRDNGNPTFGNWVNEGVVEMDATSTLTTTGDWTQTQQGQLSIGLLDPQIGGHGVINIGGTATLDGPLILDLGDPFLPDVGTQFPVLTANGLQFTFASHENAQINDDLHLLDIYSDSGLTFLTNAGPYNTAPRARQDDDRISVNSTTVLPVLANDTDADDDPLVIVTVKTADTLGIVEIDTDRTSVTYTPPQNYLGPDSFSYVISDGRGRSSEAVVNISVEAPDLTVTNVSAPDGLLIGDPLTIPITWTVQNSAAVPVTTGNWLDRVIISRNATIGDADDIIVADFAHSETPAAGDSYIVTTDVTLPGGVSGAYTLAVVTDANNQVFEADSNNNTNTDDIEVTPPYADLIITDVTVPQSAVSEDVISVTWTLFNQGVGVTSALSRTDRVYLSTDTTLDGGDTLLRNVTASNIIAVDGSGLVQSNVTLPANIQGTFYLLVEANITGNVYEYTFTNNNTNISAAIDIVLRHADLVVNEITAPTSAFDGDTVNVGWVLGNQGVAGTGVATWNDRIYLSADTTLDAGDITLKTVNRTSSITKDGSAPALADVTIPRDLLGTYYLFVVTDVDNTVFEYQHEGNNTSLPSSAINIEPRPTPDLQVTTMQAPTQGQPCKSNGR